MAEVNLKKNSGKNFKFSNFCMFLTLTAAHIYQTDLDGLKFILEKIEFSNGAIKSRQKLSKNLKFLDAKLIF